jgi:hypothetical protein
MKTLTVNQKVKINIDPLSHGDDMSYLRIEVEVLDVQGTSHVIEVDDGEFEVELKLDVAILRVVSQEEFDYFEAEPTPLPPGRSGSNWGDSMVGSYMSIVRFNEVWRHTYWPIDVDFVEEKEVE